MKITLQFKDEGGWPMMYTLAPQSEAGDKLRIQQYALARYKDFVGLCNAHRNATKEAKQAKKEGKTPRSYSFATLFQSMFVKEREDEIHRLMKENDELKRKLACLQPDFVTGC